MAPADQPVHFLDRVYRSTNGAVAVGVVLEVRLEDRFQHELGGGLYYPIPDGRNAERSLASVRLRYRHPPHRIGPVRLRNQFLAQARQPPLQAQRLDPRKGHSVPARRTRICSGQRIGVSQDVLAVNLVVEQVEAEGRLRLRLTVQLSLKGPDRCRCCQAHRQSPSPRHLRKRTRSQGPLLRRHSPASTLLRPCPTPAMTVACRDVEAATLACDGSPPITRTTFPTCRAHYPGGSSGCACRLLPRSRGLPQMAGGSASALSLSRPAQASLTLRPAGLLSRLKRPLSRGSSPSGYPAEPLVSYQINRQLSGWNLPPLMIRAFGAHCQDQTFRRKRLRDLQWRSQWLCHPAWRRPEISSRITGNRLDRFRRLSRKQVALSERHRREMRNQELEIRERKFGQQFVTEGSWVDRMHVAVGLGL